MSYLANLKRAPHFPGRLGELVSCFVSTWIACGMLFPELSPPNSPTLQTLAFVLGPGSIAWFMLLGALPLVGICTGRYVVRRISTTLSMFTWIAMALLVAIQSAIFAPATGSFLGLFFMVMWADYRLRIRKSKGAT